MGKVGVGLIAALLCLTACGGDDDDSGLVGPAGSGGGGGAAGTTMMPGGGTTVLTGDCAGANVSIGGPMLHANAMMALSGMTASCGLSSSCHQGMRGKANLTLMGQTDLKTLLVGKASCEVPSIPLVDPSGNAAGLDHSWLWIKLMHPVDSQGNLMADPSWGMGANCGQANPGTFGVRMPWGIPSGMTWPDATKVRDWICAGAPGPM